MRSSEAAHPRLADLERIAIEEGHGWATRTLARLQLLGRAVGGWPGTLSEAAMLITTRLSIAFPEASGVSRVRMRHLARLTYLTARHEWLARAEPESGN